ncbi:MAG TPA: ArsC/Spx/MgsR family protein [Saprospiraceae bacterium]|nr:arsenate reductase [Saprospiraceae bacterium]MBK8887748.1 arsenate reductase [Saprospiraceae bacterium]HQV66176.1 ArsC/Spx/MgsR family protein [Saprospiraceae bacterium]HQV96937.1 ArsC/Spx/MgsR family protein [Saprospiraceae bacterium]
MRRIYHLSTCDTCRKILSTLDLSDVELINIREQNITKDDLDFMKKQTKSYEALFNKRAQKLKELPENKKPVKDADFKKLILKEYTFLKRPAAIIDNQVIVGNDPKSVQALQAALPLK